MKYAILPLVLAAASGAFAAPFQHDVATTDELRARGGLPNLFAKLKAGGEVRIAYLGGSITAARGWRPKTLAWYREQFPKATVTEINAAISGTGSDYGACRLQEDVLQHQPDLVFLECRVNGGGGFERKSVEGIVRRIWQANPRTDICFVYTIGEWMLPSIRAGKNVSFGSVMEEVANHYGIPSIDLGVEVVRREKEGSLVFRAATPMEGKLVFSADGVHPGDAGHDIYRDVIARSMLAMQGNDRAQPHSLVEPLGAGAWETATLLPVDKVQWSDGWEKIDIEKDPVYRADFGRTHGMLRGAYRCNRAGESITVRFSGTTVGISDIPSAEPIVLEATLDGGKTVSVTRTETPRKYARFWYAPEQAPGEHTVRFTIKQIPEGVWFYAGQVLVVGKPLP